ncbi:MAG: hypothetical protein WA398_07535 [Nitrososphaeraceae archaeon]
MDEEYAAVSNTRGPLYSTKLLFMALISQQEKRLMIIPTAISVLRIMITSTSILGLIARASLLTAPRSYFNQK